MKRFGFIARFGSIMLAAALSVSATAQDIDPQLTGHTTSPFALNPSAVGEAQGYRASVNYRMQWPRLENEYRTLRVTYDQNIFKLISAVGVHYIYDTQAKAFKSHDVGLTYAHNIRIVEGHYIRLGLTAGMIIKKLGEDLVFGDQWMNGSVTSSSIESDHITESVSMFDCSFGASYVLENKLKVGAAIYHITAPKYGFIDENAIELSRRYAIHASYMHNLQSQGGLWGNRGKVENYIMGTLAYHHQGDYNIGSINVGAFISYIMLGVSYKQDFRTQILGRLNTVSFMIGGNYKGLQAYYTYDLFTSQQTNGSWSHEMSLVYVLAPKHFKYSCPVVYW